MNSITCYFIIGEIVCFIFVELFWFVIVNACILKTSFFTSAMILHSQHSKSKACFWE